jgi:hypothetical protein
MSSSKQLCRLCSVENGYELYEIIVLLVCGLPYMYFNLTENKNTVNSCMSVVFLMIFYFILFYFYLFIFYKACNLLGLKQ